MSEGYDWNFRRLMEIDDEEHRGAVGEYLLAMIDAADEGKQDPAASIFDAVGRAKLARETGAEKQ